jgi:uridine phosphorylase
MRKHIGLIEEYKHLNILNFEMESGTLFKAGNVYGVKTGCVCVVVANRTVSERIPIENIDKNILICAKKVVECFDVEGGE